jgi:hypothetical protein
MTYNHIIRAFVDAPTSVGQKTSKEIELQRKEVITPKSLSRSGKGNCEIAQIDPSTSTATRELQGYHIMRAPLDDDYTLLFTITDPGITT